MNKIAQIFILELNPKLCVLSTVGGNNQPESAVMAYALLDDLTIILSTHKDSRKWMNIEKNNKVSLVFGWHSDGCNVQYEGDARLITEDKETEDIYYSANPEHVKYRDLPGMAFIKVIPRWIRLSDFSVMPPKISETNI